MRILMLTFASLAALSWAQQPSSGQAPPAPLIRENATVKLAEHVWAIPDFNVSLVPNVGIVVGSKATLDHPLVDIATVEQLQPLLLIGIVAAGL